ncbi:hypothetical protein BJ508DRAFT_327209 [Ascobolus immersus RN42]|uniref:Uncharacterized protein n=1 Tax=Ascobolus immersus RN42 TaxID=1160509 RepID=A0A3N4I8N3_ASCIM|nr:hypothetical protein BJ508DRAFT_327209 [Ascobolus immersus RN42]
MAPTLPELHHLLPRSARIATSDDKGPALTIMIVAPIVTIIAFVAIIGVADSHGRTGRRFLLAQFTCSQYDWKPSLSSGQIRTPISTPALPRHFPPSSMAPNYTTLQSSPSMPHLLPRRISGANIITASSIASDHDRPYTPQTPNPHNKQPVRVVAIAVGSVGGFLLLIGCYFLLRHVLMKRYHASILAGEKGGEVKEAGRVEKWARRGLKVEERWERKWVGKENWEGWPVGRRDGRAFVSGGGKREGKAEAG